MDRTHRVPDTTAVTQSADQIDIVDVALPIGIIPFKGLLLDEIDRGRRIADDLRPDFPPAFGRIRGLISALMQPWFPGSISLQIPAA